MLCYFFVNVFLTAKSAKDVAMVAKVLPFDCAQGDSLKLTF